MGTRATIALESNRGEIRQIYCSFNGGLFNPRWDVGPTLLKSWGTRDKVSALIELGSIEALRACLLSTKFHMRDYNEAYDAFATTFADIEGWHKGRSEAFNYIFRQDDHWYVSFDSHVLLPLDVAISSGFPEYE